MEVSLSEKGTPGRLGPVYGLPLVAKYPYRVLAVAPLAPTQMIRHAVSQDGKQTDPLVWCCHSSRLTVGPRGQL